MQKHFSESEMSFPDIPLSFHTWEKVIQVPQILSEMIPESLLIALEMFKVIFDQWNK